MLQRLMIFLALLSLLSGCSGTFSKGIFSDKDSDADAQPPPAKVEEPLTKEGKTPAVEEKPPTDPASDLGNLIIIGEVEYVYIGSERIRLAARIDTGATTSSLGAKEITPFESDGKKWVRFQIVEPRSGKSTAFKRRMTRIVKIKHRDADTATRYVVKLPVTLGAIKRDIEFSLTDRSDFKYPALIGRNFLKGKAVVDVNRKFATTPMAGK